MRQRHGRGTQYSRVLAAVASYCQRLRGSWLQLRSAIPQRVEQ